MLGRSVQWEDIAAAHAERRLVNVSRERVRDVRYSRYERDDRVLGDVQRRARTADWAGNAAAGQALQRTRGRRRALLRNRGGNGRAPLLWIQRRRALFPPYGDGVQRDCFDTPLVRVEERQRRCVALARSLSFVGGTRALDSERLLLLLLTSPPPSSSTTSSKTVCWGPSGNGQTIGPNVASWPTYTDGA